MCLMTPSLDEGVFAWEDYLMSYPLVSTMPHHVDRYRLPIFTTESGTVLRDVDIAYETYGTLHRNADNVILLCHALTGDAHAGDSKDHAGWWGSLIGPEKTFDTDEYFIVCANVIGGCSGSTGPHSLMPGTTTSYGARFPEITIRDMVRAQYALLRALGVQQLQAVVGGSMGGMQALEWGLCYPAFVKRVAVLAASPAFSTAAIAYNEVMREAILCDPNFHGGDYAQFGVSPDQGLRIARMLGMITYRTAQLFRERFGREQTSADVNSLFQIGSYLRHQGDKLVRRFDANSYLTLMRAMDLHDIYRGRGDAKQTYASFAAQLLFVGIEDDLLFPPSELQEAVQEAVECGVDAVYSHITSKFGHDAFLLEFDQLEAILRGFLLR